MEVRLGEVDSLVVRQDSSLENICHNGVTLDLACLETNQAVIDEDEFPWPYFGGDRRIVHAGLFGVSIHHSGRKTKDASGRDLAWSLTERSQTDFRSLQVLQDGEWQVELATDLLYGSNRGKSFFVCTMGEIDPKDIHTMLRKRLDHFLRIRRRPKCGDDLGAFDVHVVRHAFLHGQDTDCLSRIHDSPRLSGTNEKGHRRLSVVRIWRDWNLLDRDLLAGGFGQVYPCPTAGRNEKTEDDRVTV